MGNPPLVYLINTNWDTLELLQIAMEQNGFATAACLSAKLKTGEVSFEAECKRRAPSAVIYDIGPPYEREWRFMQELTQTRSCAGIPFIVTTTNEPRLRRYIGPTEPVLELFNKPYELDRLVDAVRHAVERRPSNARPESEP